MPYAALQKKKSRQSDSSRFRYYTFPTACVLPLLQPQGLQPELQGKYRKRQVI